MDSFDFHPPTSSLTTLRRASIEAPISILKPTSCTLRRLSLTNSTTAAKKTKTVSFALPRRASLPTIPSNSITTHSPLYTLHTAYLFTSKDIKTILVPQTIFGLINAYTSTLQTQADITSTLSTLPMVLTWIFLNLLPFCIDNQRQPGSVAEDMLNKPSRPLPSKRLSADEAYVWMLVLYGVAFAFSLLVSGGTSMCLALMVLGWLYNDCKFSESGVVGRNVLTAAGYAAFGVGAVMVATPTSTPATTITSLLLGGLSPKLWLWVAVLAVVIGCTGQMTDMADLEGDKSRGRTNTIPILLGEDVAKWTIIVPVAFFSLFCPWFWDARFLGFVLPAMVGERIIVRLLIEEGTAAAYKKTNHIWNLWVAVLYILPLFAKAS